MSQRSKVMTRLGRRHSPRLAMINQVSPIAEDQGQEQLEEDQEHLEQEAAGNLPEFITPADEVLGDNPFEDQLQEQLEEQEQRTEEERQI